MAFPIDWQDQTDPRVLMNSTKIIETQIMADIQLAIEQLHNMDMDDEEIFDVITQNMGGSLTENQTVLLAKALGIA